MGLAIIYLYDSTVTDFTYNGQPLNKAYEAVVDNMINDSFFVTFNHPLDDKGIYKNIEKDKIVKVHTPDGMQPFRIMDRVKYMDHISIEAWPLFYADMRNKLVKPLAIRGLSGQAAVSAFVNNLLIDTPFTFTSNITATHDYHTQNTEERESNPNQLYNALDVFKDIVKRWQGELVINGYDVRVVNRLGKNTGALLYEKKNISDFTDEESIQDITTRLYGKSEWTERPEGTDEEVKHEISVKVESPLINAYSGIVFEKQYTNNDIRTEKEMKDWLNLKFTTDNIDKPSRNIKVGTNIVDDTVINMGDSLVLKYVKHDVDMEIRMVGYNYDGYANRYITIQLGDAKQSYVGNVQNTVRELETNVNTSVKQTVNQILNANGERMIYSVTEPVGNFKNGDVWYDQQGGMYFWDEEKGMWVDHPYNRNMNVVAGKVDDAAKKADEAVQAAKDADAKANSALKKAGANANLLDTHKNTLDTINTVTLPDISSTAGTALANAKSAMDEAKLADGKIADYVTKNGLVSGTTVDSKIDTATGEISRKITTVEGKIPTSIGNRNYIQSKLDPYTSYHSLSSSDDGRSFKFTMTNNNNFIVFKNSKGTPYDGISDTYTFSAYVLVNGAIPATTPLLLSAITTDSPLGTSEYDATTGRLVITQKITSFSWVVHMNIQPNLKASGTVIELKDANIVRVSKPSDWSPAPEDNLSQSTYLKFYENEYKRTAQGVTDTWTAVNKIVDKDGNTTDTFAKAVYEQNATRRTEDFTSVTSGLVKESTYTAGINGLNGSITTIQGKLDNLKIGGENLIVRNTSLVGYYISSNGTVIHGGGNADVTTDWIDISGAKELTFTTYDSFEGVFAGRVALYSDKSESNFISIPVSYNSASPIQSYTFEVPENVTYARVSVVYGETLRYKLEKGNVSTDWSLAPEDMLGKADFQVFKTTYEANDKTIKARLLAVDSGKEGSIAYRLNETESTASGNTKTISDIKTKPGEQITGYQTMKERSDLYERVIGSYNEATVKQNMSRIVMTDSVFQTEVVDKQSLISGAASGTGMTKDPSFDKGVNGLKVYDNGNTGTITIKQVKIPSTTSFPPPKGTDGYRVDIVHAPSTATSPDRGGVVNVTNGWAGGTVVVKFVAFLPTGRSFNYHNNNLGTGYTGGWLTDNKGTGKWETYMYYYRFGTGSVSIFGHLTVIGASTGFTWYLSDYDIINVNETSASKITQLQENINLKVSKEGLISQINLSAGNALIEVGTNKLNVTPDTTFIQDATIKSAMIESLEADKITTGTFDASKAKIINLDAESITANQAKLIQAGFESSSGGTLALSGDQFLSTASDGSQVYLQNGVMGVRRPSKEGGGTIGQIGYVYDGGSPTYTIQTSWGSHFALKQRFYDSYTKLTKDKRAMYVSTGDDGNTTMQFYAKDFVLQGDRNLRFGYDHYINGIGNDLTLTGKESVTVRANESTVFVVSSNGKNNYASMHANLNMAGNTVTNTSDIRLKRDIVNDEIDSLSALMKWQHAGFNYINPDMNQERQFSVIAQSAPDLAFAGEDGYLQVSLNKQVNMTSHALQQHVIKTNDKVEQLEAKIASLQDELALLKGA